MSESSEGGADRVELPFEFGVEPSFEPARGEDIPLSRWTRSRRAPALFEFDEPAPPPAVNRISGNGGGDGNAQPPKRDRPASEPTVGTGFTLAERQDPE